MSSSAGSSAVESLLTDALAELVNASLNLDPSSAARLSALDGRSIRLIADFPPPLSTKHFTLRVENARLRLYPYDMAQPNVIVEGSITELVGSLRGIQSAEPGSPRIDGDATVLQEVSGLFRGFAPDLSGPLAGLIGSDAADNLVGMGELAAAALRSAAEGVSGSLRQRASEQFACRPQLDQLLDSMDDMRLRIDRLAARVDSEEARRQAS